MGLEFEVRELSNCGGSEVGRCRQGQGHIKDTSVTIVKGALERKMRKKLLSKAHKGPCGHQEELGFTTNEGKTHLDC